MVSRYVTSGCLCESRKIRARTIVISSGPLFRVISNCTDQSLVPISRASSPRNRGIFVWKAIRVDYRSDVWMQQLAPNSVPPEMFIALTRCKTPTPANNITVSSGSPLTLKPNIWMEKDCRSRIARAKRYMLSVKTDADCITRVQTRKMDTICTTTVQINSLFFLEASWLTGTFTRNFVRRFDQLPSSNFWDTITYSII